MLQVYFLHLHCTSCLHWGLSMYPIPNCKSRHFYGLEPHFYSCLYFRSTTWLTNAMNVGTSGKYFKTATPGESSISLVENLSDPVTVYLFFQLGMDVTDEIRTYFDELPTDNLNIRYVDKDIEPTLAKELSVQNNGMIVLSTGEGDTRSIERINIGKTLSAAKRKLKKLDEEFREALLTLTKEPSVLYLTTGHGR